MHVCVYLYFWVSWLLRLFCFMIALVLINLFLVIFDVVFFLVLLLDDLDYALGSSALY
jgi:hypothetical protein